VIPPPLSISSLSFSFVSTANSQGRGKRKFKRKRKIGFQLGKGMAGIGIPAFQAKPAISWPQIYSGGD
jgi:hypothetical protein